jgi:hypothetical protein
MKMNKLSTKVKTVLDTMSGKDLEQRNILESATRVRALQFILAGASKLRIKRKREEQFAASVRVICQQLKNHAERISFQKRKHAKLFVLSLTSTVLRICANKLKPKELICSK